MPRPRKDAGAALGLSGAPSNLVLWAESLGEALGRGVARGINAGLSVSPLTAMVAGLGAPRRRGRPPKVFTGGPVPADQRCKVEGCPRPARAKGLCSAHYQADRRRQLGKKA
jgi:hypothetical protein